MNRQFTTQGTKLLCSFLFSVFTLVLCTKKAILSLDYNIDRAYYESVCENKNKPEMACHGKCKLQKNSQKADFSFSVHQLSLEFCSLHSPLEFVPLNQNPAIAGKGKIAEQHPFILPETISSIPVPPPNI